MRFFPTSERLDDADIARGMRLLMTDTIFYQMMTVLTSGVIMTDFARGLEPDSDTLIGILAAAPSCCQMLQVPTIALVERYRNRRAITVIAATIGRIAWFGMPALLLMNDRGTAATVMIAIHFMYYAGTYIGGCSISAWLRDLVPDAKISGYFGKRLALATTASALTLLAVLMVLPGNGVTHGTRMRILAGCYVAGGVFGLISSAFIASAPEPKLADAPRTPLLRLLREPLADAAFKKFLAFNALWYAVYGATWQFFAKLLLARFGLSLPAVTTITMGVLLANALFFRLWSRVAVKRDDRATLMGAMPLYLVGLALLPAAEFMPGARGVALAVAAFAVCGCAYAGLQLGVTNLGLKLAPKGKAASYIACNSLVAGFAATVSPMLAGPAADFLDGKGSRAGMWHPDLPVSGLAAVFLLVIGAGLLSLKLLERVPAPARHSRRDIYGDVFAEALAATASAGFFIPRLLSILPVARKRK